MAPDNNWKADDSPRESPVPTASPTSAPTTKGWLDRALAYMRVDAERMHDAFLGVAP